MSFNFSYNFMDSLQHLLTLLFISIMLGYTITVIVKNNEAKRKHEEKMQELRTEWSSEEAKEILKLIKDIYN